MTREPALRLYDRSGAHDLLLVQWWERLHREGDFDRVFHVELAPLGTFMRYWTLPRALMFDVGDGGIVWAAWFEPCLNGASVSLWAAPELRRTRYNLAAWDRAMTAAFVQWPVLLSVTRFGEIAEQMVRLGYTMLGTVPGLLGDGPTWIGYLTEAAHGRRREGGRRWRRRGIVPAGVRAVPHSPDASGAGVDGGRAADPRGQPAGA